MQRQILKPWMLTLLVALGCGAGGEPVRPRSLSFRMTPYALEAGAEEYHCWWFRPQTQDGAAIQKIRPLAGPGVHHMALFWAAGDRLQPDRACPDLGATWILVAGSGVNSGEVVLPDGLALPVHPTGAYVVQMHLVNATPSRLTVEGGYDLALSTAASYQRVGLYLTGTMNIQIPPRAQAYPVEATCTGDLPDSVKLISLFPHMHGHGRRFMVEHNGAPLYDRDWVFDEQTVEPLRPPVAAGPGDTLRVRCIYDNPSNQTVSFGLRTSDEMCFGVFYYYPAPLDQIFCLA